MVLLHTSLHPSVPSIELGRIELARIDCHAVQGYKGGAFSPDLVEATEAQARLILAAEIVKLGPEPELPQWVADYANRDFQPYGADPNATMDEFDWITAMGDSGRVITSDAMANMAKACYADTLRDMRLRRERPQFTKPQARVVRAALGFRAVSASDPVVRLEANIARRRYANVPHAPVDILASSENAARGLYRRLAAIAF